MMKKILLVGLALLLCFGAVGCAKSEDAPEGMKLASLEGEPFRLYVPQNWTLNEGSGISGAFFFGPEQVVATARYVTPEEEISSTEFLTSCSQGYALTLEDYKALSIDAAVLGSEDASKLSYTMTLNETDYSALLYATVWKGDVVSLHLYFPSEKQEELQNTLSAIVEEFVLCERSEPVRDFVTDKNTPEGMIIASSDKLQYRLYVPKHWVCHSESGVSEAHYPESAPSHVSLTAYTPDEVMTAEEYWDFCEKEYEDTLAGFSLIETEKLTVAEKDALSATYRVTYDGVTFCIQQTSFVYRELVYTLTYTALDDVFESHLDDVTAMLDAFCFR